MSYDRIFAYCDCFSGVSGDMFLGALLDVGAPVDAINDSLKSLLSDEVQISSKKERRGSIWGTRAIVNINSPSDQPVRTFRSISALLEKSSLPSWVISKSIEIFRIIAEAESTIHNVPLEEVHFHEIG
ncbi:MAG: nickel insertion protein, partial [Thermodesulforhabdaceae bacterium]